LTTSYLDPLQQVEVSARLLNVARDLLSKGIDGGKLYLIPQTI
jgi:hypothetical protein